MQAKPTAFADSATMADLVRHRIYVGLDEIRDSTISVKRMRDLKGLAEELGADDAAEAAKEALNGLAAAATS